VVTNNRTPKPLVAVVRAKDILTGMAEITATVYEFPCDRCGDVNRLITPAMVCGTCFMGGKIVDRTPRPRPVVRLHRSTEYQQMRKAS
jgi:hypothetical protein